MGERTEGMKKQAQELIEQAYQRGYKAGYEEGKGQAWSEEVKKYEIEPEKSWKYIEQGRNEAWEAAKKLVDSKNVNEILDDDTLFYCVNIFERHTASEAINKLRAYEEQKKQEADEEIKVGDEVFNKNVKKEIITFIVVKITDDSFGCEGFASNGGWVIDRIENLKKTGRTFPEIAEVLKKLQEGK